MSVSRRGFLAGLGGLGTAAVLSACGSSDSGSSGSTASAGSSAAFSGKGPINFATGKDTTGKLQEILDGWNKSHPDEKVTLKELPESADDQRSAMIQNFQVKSDAYSVVGMDPIWVAEFASQQWVQALPSGTDTSKLLKSSVDAATYFKKLYGVPFTTNGELLFYRKDLLDAAGVAVPKTWDEMWAAWEKVKGTPAAKGMTAYAGQLSKYEGLTVNFTSAVLSAGGAVYDEENKPTVNTDEAKAGLQTLVDGFKKGYIGKPNLTYKEEESRQAFQDGKVMFLVNWPYVYPKAAATDGSSKVAGKFGIAPVPGIGSGTGTTVLGGLILGVSSFAKNKATALAFAQYMATESVQKEWTIASSQAPVATSLYSDADVIKAYPYTETLKKALDNAGTRPMAHNYGDVTLAIQNAVYPALSGGKSVDETLKSLQSKLETLAK
ncbi:MAG: ABC transporter substrate-binding protein [Acidipropionibacterium acidipropionici]|jgi:multiple sugar transport system substrate-binding protein|uniref:ABC transporter substrate-binding protein n=2 Tax=Acidipropionibacterium acidipropionici TaxID=1748 RepID=A0A142KHE8_9ACTN|nr:ABC transporter substrate-binding protein [Acidipropionibacterium acidipropionici]AFV90937.1 Extracellular solute-binding protein family 1 [Acidipropionibacterium acidipropionici ATCC 4875]ALN14953.1 ABC transporter substrate-binding protein [Acidipropionibacterium acidipropionici]AMS05536.1 ABC transporter substrate-binding protein [Acidipropionibacterium acidipropionici]AOZ47006.1 ABC transporter substrate-binding protein [Acidipropionibacterium acidipropionici]APZ09296.1 ABC transporter 